jgi:LysR family transcriptional regulator, carnitine catabolism transcriptional activator
MNLTQRQLQMFVTTAALMNISRSSEVLHISQPALSRALQELEAQLGVKLLLRTTRHLALTHDGSRFLPVAQRLLRDLEQASSDLREEAMGLTGAVTLAVGTAFGCTVLPNILRSFAQSHPGVRLKLIDDNSEGISSRVVRAEADLGIGSLFGDTSGLTCHLLLAAPVGLLGDPARFNLVEAVENADLSEFPLLKEPSDSSIMQVLQHRGSALVQHMVKGVEVSSLSLKLALAQAGVGVAVLSALGASHSQARHLQFVPLKPAMEREVFIIQRLDRELNPSAKAFANAIHAGLADTQLHPTIRRFENKTQPKNSRPGSRPIN